MNIPDLKKHVEALGCKILKSSSFSLVASCDDDVFIIKEPESRLKVLVNSENMENITKIVPTPTQVKPKEVVIGKFKKQGPWSKILKLGNLDEVEYVYGEDELKKSKVKKVKESLARLERANKFAYMPSHDGIDPLNVVQKEVDFLSGYLMKSIEDGIAAKTNNNVICGSKNLIRKSWTKAENEKYRFLLKVNCKVPSLLNIVNEKLDNIGSWKTLSESDRFYIKSVMPPFGNVFLTGIKLLSDLGRDQIEFELVSDNKIKKNNFLENMRGLKEDGFINIKSDESPLDMESLMSGMEEED